MKNKSSLARGTLALSIAGILSKVISILYTPILKVILGDIGYGMYCQVLEVFLFIYSLTTVGSQPAVAKVVAEFSALAGKKNSKKILSISIKLYFYIGLAGSILLALLSVLIGNILGNNLTYGILALSPCVLITCILSTCRGFMQGNGNMKVIAISQIIEQFMNVVISLLCAYMFLKYTKNISFAVSGAQIGTSISALIAIVYIIIIYRFNLNNNDHYETAINSKKVRNQILIYSLPIIMSSGLQNLGGIIDMLNVQSQLLSIGLSKDNANILYGHYGLYKTLIGVPMVIITSISTTVLPSISKAKALCDRNKINLNIKFAYKLALIISIPAAVGLSSVSDLLYYSLFNNNNGSMIMKIGSFILILMSISQIQVAILQGINKLYYVLCTYALGIMLKIILNYIFVSIPEINIYGVLIGNCAWYLLPIILNHKKIINSTSYKLNLNKLIFKSLFCSLLMTILIFTLNIPIKFICNYNTSRLKSIIVLSVSITVGLLTYVYTMIVLRGIRKSDIKYISPKLIKILPYFIQKRLH